MKTIFGGILIATTLFASVIQTRAIEGLKVSIQGSNAMVSWPSQTGATYIVQYRPTLNTNDVWTTLTNNLPGTPGTNWTSFIHFNSVQYPGSGIALGDTNIAPPPPPEYNRMSLQTSSLTVEQLAARREQLRQEADAALADMMDLLSNTVAQAEADRQAWIAAGRPARIQNTAQSMSTSEMDTSQTVTNTGFYKVVRNGVHVIGLTNGSALSGTVSFLVEVGNGSGELNSLSVMENGAPVGNSSQFAPFTLPLMASMDTTQMSNGVHQIFVSSSWYLPGSDGDGILTPYVQAESTLFTVTVQNEISFSGWMPSFGQETNLLFINAQSAHASADWEIDIYGEQYNYIGTFRGHTDNGIISGIWNLLGPNQEYHADNFFIFVITTSYSTGSSMMEEATLASASRVSPKTYRNWERWADRGDWVVVNQLAWENLLGGDDFDIMTDGFVSIAHAYGLDAYPYGNEWEQAFRIHWAGTNYPQPTLDWQTFRQSLYWTNSRSLFYFGHGGDDGIGRDASYTNRFISQKEIASVLKTIPAGQTNRHNFRFVFLDGCETAKGKLPEAFGIIPKENLKLEAYDYSAVRPSTFVGWNDSPAAAFDDHSILMDHVYFIQNFQYLWSTGLGVRAALDQAKDSPLSTAINPKNLTVFGYKDLGPNQYNGR